MARHQKLEPVIKIKQRREQQAGQQLQKTSSQRQHHMQLLDQLTGYRTEYLQRMDRVLKQGVGVEQLSGYRSMLAELDAALEQEQVALQWAENDWQQAREVWQQARAQVELIAGLSQQYLRRGQQLDDHTEQERQEEIHRNQSY